MPMPAPVGSPRRRFWGIHMRNSSEISQLLDQWNGGDRSALAELMPLIMDDLRRMAGKQMAVERVDHTLQPTALVNEIYLKLIGRRIMPATKAKNCARFCQDTER
ncbi:MAG: ECF-type sigma factor, partial [Acidobacteriota bacterium]